ncbi:hypothetical protein ACOSQ3_031768 [Xanthoceras sorbifolium]
MVLSIWVVNFFVELVENDFTYMIHTAYILHKSHYKLNVQHIYINNVCNISNMHTSLFSLTFVIASYYFTDVSSPFRRHQLRSLFFLSLFLFIIGVIVSLSTIRAQVQCTMDMDFIWSCNFL